jgi:hypothetical protein
VSTRSSAHTVSEKSPPALDQHDAEDDVLTPQISELSLQLQPSLTARVTSVGTTGTTDPNFEVDFEENDPENPQNWSMGYKAMAISFLSWNTLIM